MSVGLSVLGGDTVYKGPKKFVRYKTRNGCSLPPSSLIYGYTSVAYFRRGKVRFDEEGRRNGILLRGGGGGGIKEPFPVGERGKGALPWFYKTRPSFPSSLDVAAPYRG